MKKLLRSVILITAFAAIFFAGCQNPFITPVLNEPEPAETETGGEITTGVTFTIPRYAPWIGPRFTTQAFGFVDSVHIVVYDSSMGEVISEYAVPPSEVEGSSSFSFTVILGEGTGYTAEIEIYNEVVSTTEPMVSGISAQFDITQGDVTQVPVTCIPENPVALATPGLDYINTLAAAPLNVDGYPVATGGEVWYSITAPSSGYYNIAITVPADIGFFFGVFDSTGVPVVPVGSVTGGPGPDVINGQGTSGEVYYIGLVPGAFGPSGDIEVTANWTEVTPLYLRDTDVPDAGLRMVLSSYFPGKEFSVGGLTPDQENWITDWDLATITDLSYNTPITVNNLTGLEYCDRVNSIDFYNFDLAGCDQSSGGSSATAFEGMESLTWLTLYDCNLTSLDFISALSALEGLTTSSNPRLDINDFTPVLTSTNFPQLQYLYLTGWDLNGDDALDASDAFTGADWEGVLDLLSPFTDLRSLELTSFYQGDTEFERLFDTGEVLDTNAGCLTSFFTNNANITDTAVGLISGLTALEYLALSGNSGITDISSLSGMGTLELVNANYTSITDLTPFQDMYSSGAFRNHFSYAQYDIDVTNCGLDISPSSTNRSIVDDLISNGVRVDYEAGNQLEEPGVVLTTDDVPDENLRTAFENATGKVFGEITDNDLRGLNQLIAPVAGISDLAGIEYCEGIYFLLLNGNPISDLTPLVALQDYNLNSIDMYGCGIDDLSPLVGFNGLLHLKLMDNPLHIDDFQILTPANFPSLSRIHVDGWDEDLGETIANADQIVTILSEFSNMEDIGLGSFALDDTSFQLLYDNLLSGSTATLQHLHLYQNELTDLSFGQLSAFTNLQTLNIFNNLNLTDISFMAGMTQLEYLTLSYNRIGDITLLEDLYDAGAFRTEGWRSIAIEANGMLIWDGTDNRSTVDYLIGLGVPVTFEYENYTEPVATYTSMTPENGPVGTTVTLQGEGFETQTEKHLVFEWYNHPHGGAVGGIGIVSWSDTEIVFTVPDATADEYGVQVLDLDQTSDHRGTHYPVFTITE